MRNIIQLIFLVFLVISCENAIDPINDKGTIFLSSVPDKAEIYIDGKNTGKKTPTDIESPAGIHQITLKLEGYANYTFVDTVFVNLESIVPIINLKRYGLLVINSDPSGASIYIDEVNTQETTPKIFTQPDGAYSVKLRAEDHADTTIDVVIENAQDVELDVNLRGEFVTYFSGKVLYDTTNTTINQPSGLNFETGNLLNISENSGQRFDADIIFVPNQFGGYELRTPNGTNGMFRDTRFKVSKSTNFNDNEDSPTEDPTWKNSFPATTKNYVFGYTSDGHYVKIQIVKLLENPYRVELRWIINDNTFDSRF